MKLILLISAAVTLVGCGKKEPVQPSVSNIEATKPEKITGNEATQPTTPDIEATKPEPTKAKATAAVNLWKFETGGFVQSSPAIGSDGTIYVGSWDNKLHAINGKNGAKLWEFETGGDVDSSPTIGSDGTVYIGSKDKKLYALSGKSGVKLWEFETGGDVESSPAIGSDGTVYIGSKDKKLYALSGRSGVKLWEFETRDGVSSSPAIGSDGTVYVGSWDNKLYAINGKSGSKLWEFETGDDVSSSPAIGSDGTVYVGSWDNKLYAINGKSGGKLWEFETGSYVSSSPAIGPDGTIYIGSSDKKLYAINGKSGVKLWVFETGAQVLSSPAIDSDGTIYVGSYDKKLYAINGKSGSKLWEFETGTGELVSGMRSSPAIGSDGTLYVGSFDTKLYAIKTESLGLAKSPWPMRGQNARHTGHATTVSDPLMVKAEPGSLAANLRGKRIHFEGDTKKWIQFNRDGTLSGTNKGNIGKYAVDGLKVTITDDKGKDITAKFTKPTINTGDKFIGVEGTETHELTIVKVEEIEPKPAKSKPRPDRLAERLLIQKDYAEIEKAISHYITSKSRTLDGTWDLYLFHRGLSGILSSRSSEEKFKQQITRLDIWIQDKPDSSNAKIAKALMLDAYAWKARGGGLANSVTDDGWKLFKQRLQKASDLLSRSKGRGNPMFFYASQKVATGLSMPNKDYYELIAEGARLHPEFDRIHTTAVWHLAPRWNGSPREWQRYRDTVVSKTPASRKAQLYYLISNYALRFNGLTHKGQNTDWKIFKRGGEEWLARYPSMVRQEEICLLACVETDKAAAKRYFLWEPEHRPYRSKNWAKHTNREIDDWRKWAFDGSNWEKTKEVLEQQAQQGDANAQYELGSALSNRNETRNRNQALAWLKKASDQGHILAELHSAVINKRILIASAPFRNPILAELKRAAETGYAGAQYQLGRKYLLGENELEKNPKLAGQWLLKAANQGNGSAKYYLAGMYSTGRDRPKNLQQATHWAKLALKTNPNQAQFKRLLDRILEQASPAQVRLAETSVAAFKPTKEVTIEKLKEWAEDGDPRAQTILGVKYIAGWDGLKKDPVLAEKLWLRAAKQGWSIAQNNLGNVFSRGRVRPKDLVQAYYWASLADSGGISNAKQTLARIRNEATPAQIKEADALLKDFKPVPENTKPTKPEPSAKTQKLTP